MTRNLSDREVHVWYCSSDDPLVAARQQDYMRLMSADECDRYERYAFEKDRQLFLVARALLRTVLSQYVSVAPEAWSFQQTAMGKPFLALDPDWPPLQFNLSHSQQRVACAVTLTHPVGIDVECITRRVDPQVAKHFLSPKEEAQFLQATQEERREIFFRCWTLKESYAKALGLGLSLRLTDFSFLLHENRPPVVCLPNSAAGSAEDWQFFQQRIEPRYYLAVAVRCPRQQEIQFSLTHARPLLDSMFEN